MERDIASIMVMITGIIPFTTSFKNETYRLKFPSLTDITKIKSIKHQVYNYVPIVTHFTFYNLIF